MKYLHFLIFIFLITVSRAATLNSNGSQSDTQAKVNSAANGDTVILSSINTSWSSGVSIGSKAITIQGAGVGKTIINFTGGGNVFTFTQHASIGTRITGITFNGAAGLNRQIIGINGNPGDAIFRIDHCRFYSSAGDATFITTRGQGRGLIDNCEFESGNAPNEMIHNEAYGNGSNTGWAYAVRPGSDDALYIEDNSFRYNASGNPAYFWGSSAAQNYYGSRTVFRHNTSQMAQFDNHGTPGMRGGRWYEIYDNTFITVTNANQSDYIALRAGSGVVFGNNHTGPNSGTGAIRLMEEDSGSYPVQDQIGRGQNQTLDPLYIWNNTGMSVSNNTTSLIQLNRDYFVDKQRPGYTPYVYPHPLQGGSTPTPTPVPTPNPTPNPTPTPVPTPTPPIVAGTVYVDQDNSQSSDSTSNGTEAKPYKTIEYALGRIQSGGTILIKKSSSPYNVGFLNITGPSGSAGKSTQLKAYSADKPILKGAGVNNYYTVSLNGLSYFDIEGLDISNADNAILIRNTSHHINIRNCNLHDTGQEIVRVQNNSHTILFENNILTNGGILKSDSNGEAFYIGSFNGGDDVHDVIIRGNTMSNIEYEAVDLMSDTHNCIIENNVIHDVIVDYQFGKWAISLHSTVQLGSNPNHIIRGNIIYNVGDAGLTQDGTGAAFSLDTGAQVYNNVVYGADSNGNGIYTWGAEVSGGDNYVRYIWNNTFVLPSSQAIHTLGGTASVGNNIGPSTSGNTSYSAGLFVDPSKNNYHLKAPLPGTNPLFPIPTDIEGNQRKSPPDMGAYEFIGVTPTPTPTPVPTPTPTPIPTPVPTPTPTPPPTPTPTPVPTPTPTPPPTPTPTPVPTPVPTPPPSTSAHKISDIEGLQEALDKKADKGHTHSVPSGQTGSYKGHSHPTSEGQTGQ